MTTINISMPDALRDYVEAKAAQGHYSASEYVRHLIREDQQRNAAQERNLLWDYLAISARQLDEGDTVIACAETILAQGRARRHSASS